VDRTDSDIKLREIAYIPLPSQKTFHQLETRFKGFSGPIGSGKSQALCQEAIKLSYLNPGRLGLLGAPTYPMLRDATQASLLEILEFNEIPYELNKAENTLLMKDTRSRILFRSVEEFERLRGTNLAWFGLDELTYAQEESWLRLEGRLRDPQAKRLCGFAVWTPKGFDWVYRKFIAQEIQGYGVVRAQPYENRHLLDKVANYYEQLGKSYDAKFFDQEVLGHYVSMEGGRVYSAFDRRVHVEPLIVDPRLPLLWALDFNVDPMSSVIVQIVKGKVRVVDEIVIRHATTRDACEEFLRRFPRHGAPVTVYGDASGYHSQTSGTSDYEMVKEYFAANSAMQLEYNVPKSNPGVKDRLNLTNRQLRTAYGDIGMTVDPKCKELIQDFEEVCFKADGNQIDKDRDRLRTHLSDALGYLLWQECRGGKTGERGDGRLF
jgi:Terminase large subunit, T4likevirus-type, N-terminal